MNRHEAIIWAAGYFDGEGYIQVTPPPSRLKLNVASTEMSSVQRLIGTFGGFLGGPYNYAQKDGIQRRPYHVWSIDDQPAQRTLKEMLPYLTAKREQAQVAMFYPTSRARRSKATGRYLSLRASVVQQRAAVRTALLKLRARR